MSFDSDTFIPFLVFSIPILAITGGIISGVVKQLGRQRLIELAQRERIAAIERGVDPSKLPSLPSLVDERAPMGEAWGSRQRAQGLMVGGVITAAAGAGIMVFLMLLRPDTDHNVWAVGLIPLFVGVAMLISAALVWPRSGHGGDGSGTLR
jgi:Domain of unknown function (DUF6249)